MVGISVGIHQARLFQQPMCKHRVYSRINARIKMCTLRHIQPYQQSAVRLLRRTGAREPAGHRLARLLIQLQRTQHTPMVVGVQLRRTLRVHLLQPRIKRADALLHQLGFQPCPHGRVRLIRCEVYSVYKTGNIQSGAADHDWNASACRDLRDTLACVPDIVRNREPFFRRKKSHQMVRHTFHLLRRRLCSSHTKPFIDLHRIRRNDLAVQQLCQRNRERCFPRSRGTADHDDISLVCQTAFPAPFW